MSRDSHSMEEVSAAAWNYPLPASPVKRTLIVRDQDERELLAFWGAEITDTQVGEILDEAGYEWHKQSHGSLLLRSEGDIPNQDGLCALLQCLEDEEWTGSIFCEGDELQEGFVTVEEAKAWCETSHGDIAVAHGKIVRLNDVYHAWLFGRADKAPLGTSHHTFHGLLV